MGIILMILGSLLFTLYGLSLGPLSHEHAAWSSFGSLLAGFFTLTGTVATIATLLFLNKQNQDQQKVTNAQIGAMTFEQYINHRKLFMDRLVELQITFESRLTFLNGEKLYTEIFRNNRPTNVEFVVKPIQTQTAENLIGRLGEQLTQLDQMLDKSKWSEEEIADFVMLLIGLYGNLHYKWESGSFDGDIFYSEKNTGINIYSIEEFLHRIKTIYNSLLFYTGNDHYHGLNKGFSRYAREALIRFFNGSHRLRDKVTVRKTIPGLEILESLLFSIDMLRDTSGNWIMPSTYRMLESALGSRESVEKIRDNQFRKNLVNVGYQEGSAGFTKTGEDKIIRSDLAHCIDEITKLGSLK
ncbi:hypothetical protein BK672_08040 [Pseudomonas fluorescens]|uniref:Phage abortive infection protein n=2 Tax=Pseudomonas fluorescens TaxID=294 RepID=A0A423NE44_PSEFL|nr:hypothetical protein BK672_08040 [Pseudomonas fluorescens]